MAPLAFAFVFYILEPESKENGPLKENGPFEYVAYLYLLRENGPLKENGPSCL